MIPDESKQFKIVDDLKKLIDDAIKKINGTQENDLCKYLPGTKGGYIHHFTFRKLKNKTPDQLFSLIKENIIDIDTPKILAPSPRAPRRSRKNPDFLNFTRFDIERILELAHKSGDHDLLARFNPKRSLPTLKRELIRSIKTNDMNEQLWNTYSQTISSLNVINSLEDEN